MVMKTSPYKRNSFLSLLLVLAMALLPLLGISTPSIAAVPTPDDVFTFDNSLTSTSGVTLSPYATCSASISSPCNSSSSFGAIGGDSYWQWASSSDKYGGGFSYIASDIGSSYTFFLKFQITTPSADPRTDPYNKLIDYNNLADDDGFYLAGDTVDWYFEFYPLDTGTTSYSVTQLLELAVVRDDSSTPKTFTVYTRSLSGLFTREYVVNDPAGLSIPAIVSGNTILGFFGEDGNNEEAIKAGKVFDLRFWHDTALTSAQLNEHFAEIYTVSYDVNSSTSGSAPSSTAGSGSQVISGNTGGLQKTGYTFSGWNTQRDGGGVTHSAGGSVTSASSFTLFALWTPVGNSTSAPSSTLTALPATGGNNSTNLIFVVSCVLVLAGLTTILASRKNRIRL